MAAVSDDSWDSRDRETGDAESQCPAQGSQVDRGELDPLGTLARYSQGAPIVGVSIADDEKHCLLHC